MPTESSQGNDTLHQKAETEFQSLNTAGLGLVILELESELATAQSELAEYQSLLQDLPAIYEDKFRQHLRSTVQDIRQLLDERKVLREQVSTALANPPIPQRLAAAAEDVPSESYQGRSLEVFRQTFLSSLKLVPVLRNFLARLVSSGNRFSRPSKIVLISGGVLVGSILISKAFFVGTQQSLPVGSQALRKSLATPNSLALKLVARGGESWVSIENLSGRKLLDVILGDGETRLVDIGAGLRIRSGRPDLLYLGIGSSPLKQLGGISDLDWTEIRQPGLNTL